MSVQPQPLGTAPPEEVPLPRAPLVRVIAQVRFPQILAIRNPDKVSIFQEALRSIYPNLTEDRVQSIDVTASHAPSIRQAIIWRLADQERNQKWRVSLGVDFVALETSAYSSRQDFIARLRAVTSAVEDAFKPAEATRLGVRYIDRLTKDAVESIGDLVRPEVLGILQSTNGLPTTLGSSIIHMMTDAQFLADEGRIQARWGKFPPNATHDPDALEPIPEPSWVLDLDMFTVDPLPFESNALQITATSLAERLYSVFREMVTQEFLIFYGGEP